MGKTLLLLCAGVLVAVTAGCENQVAAGVRSAGTNTQVAVDESVRALGLDRPSMLHMRDTVPINYYTPYR